MFDWVQVRRFIYVFIFATSFYLGASYKVSIFSYVTNYADSMFASAFFVDSSTPEFLKARFAEASVGRRKMKILIVPGHDNISPGAAFRDLRETDMTLKVGEKLASLLSKELRFEVMLARTSAGYHPDIISMWSNRQSDIIRFKEEKKNIMNALMKSDIVDVHSGVVHNNALFETAFKLYGINLFSNERGFDLVLHLHFNDHPRRSMKQAGKYTGFALYVPEKQYSNSKGSMSVAESVRVELAKMISESDFPEESSVIVPDQELIAVGAFNTLDPASLVIEYGYIYEEQWRNAKIRNLIFDDLAHATSLGVEHFFSLTPSTKREISLTDKKIEKGDEDSVAVYNFQQALRTFGFYPPKGETLRSCPTTGHFGSCTVRALSAFQKEEGIDSEKEVAGSETRRALTERLKYQSSF